MRHALLPLILLGGCLDLSMAPIRQEPLLVPVAADRIATVPAVLPSDLLAVDGGFAVLDGQGATLHTFALDGTAGTVLRAEGLRGAVRAEVDGQGGYWVASPDAGEVRHLDGAGQIVSILPIDGAVAVLPRGDTLVVGLREGGVMRLPAADGARTVQSLDVDGKPLGAIAAVVADGTDVLAVDTLQHRVHRLAPASARSAFGHFGLWIGALSKPKGAAVVAGGAVAVADSSLGVVQLFDRDGHALGAVGMGAPQRFGHPMDVLAVGEQLLILDASDGGVWSTSMSAATVGAARTEASVRHLRTQLVDAATAAEPAGEARLCLQCHDGVVNDDRYAWDPALGHHPVGVVPEGDVPAFFPRDDDGALRCGTCHSPHGLSSLDDVDEVADTGGRSVLVRHRAEVGDQFTRLSRKDSQLCVGCHQDAAHDQALARLGLDGGVHSVGSALAQALRERGEDPTRGACMSCHTPHGATRPSLGRDTTDADVCLGCHPAAAGARSHPLGDALPARAAAVLPTDRAGTSCVTCHALIDGDGGALLRHPDGGGDLCVACHEQAPQGAHAGLRGHAGSSCLACHAPHQAADTPLLARAGGAGAPGGCTSCHTDRGPGHAGHPLGGSEEIGCTSCHAGGHDPANVASCETCHTGPAAAAARGGHGGQDCQSCHPPHGAAVSPVARANPASATCLACHGPGGQATRVARWDHAARAFGRGDVRWEPLMGLALYDVQGKPVASGEGGELTCQTCHHVHGPETADGPDHLRREGWEQPCAACHGEEARLRYRWFHDANKRKGSP